MRRFGFIGIDNLGLNKDEGKKELINKVCDLNKNNENRLTLMQG